MIHPGKKVLWRNLPLIPDTWICGAAFILIFFIHLILQLFLWFFELLYILPVDSSVLLPALLLTLIQVCFYCLQQNSKMIDCPGLPRTEEVLRAQDFQYSNQESSREIWTSWSLYSNSNSLGVNVMSFGSQMLFRWKYPVCSWKYYVQNCLASGISTQQLFEFWTKCEG